MGYIMAHVVPYRGGNQDIVVSKIVKDLELLGFNGQIVLKSDQEPVLEYLLKEIAKARRDALTVIEHSPVRDSSSNGLAEKGVQSLECMARTHLLEIDEKLGEKLSLDLPWFAWLIEYVADVYNKHQIGSDGATPWERRAKPCLPP